MADGTAQSKVVVNGTDVDNEAVAFIMVEMDLDQADLCTATLKNTNDKKWTVDLKLGDTVEIQFAETGGGTQKSVFKGEVMGLEPCYEAGGETHVMLRAVNKMHRLSRGKVSKTYENQTDAQIAQAICQKYSLSCNVEGDVNTVYPHVYQHHQSDFEFLLLRASRIGYEVSVDDTTLHFKKRDLAGAPKENLKLGAQETTDGKPMSKLQLRLSSANQVTQVKVRAWDPKTNKEIIGKADSLDKTLGDNKGGDLAKKSFPGTHKVTYNVPVTSQEEADNFAKSMLEDHSLNYITGEAYCKGNPDLKAGMVVTVKGTDGRFDGDYYVQGVIHKYTHKGGGSGGYTTMLKVRRNAESAGSGSTSAAAAVS